jgi:SAM-dependent methyltransferase
MNKFYDDKFYEGQRAASYKSAQSVVPLLIELVQPKSVVDFGCGVGTWLKSFAENGIHDVLGLEGEWALENGLEIDRSLFEIADLTAPMKLDRTFDLAICLEVAEHLPQSAAATLVESLTRAAPAVVFSAAIPGQGGVNHINEQWQDFWVAEFAKHGYKAVDVIRPVIWQNPDIRYWYKQNILLFMKPGASLLRQPPQEWTFNRVHEEAFMEKTGEVEAWKKLAARPDNGSGKASLRLLRHAITGLCSAVIRKIGVEN